MGKCQHCNGTGKHPTTRKECPACDGQPKKKQSRGGRAKKKRRTAPEDISSTTESSSSPPSSSSSEEKNPTSRPEQSEPQKKKRKRGQKHRRPATNGVEKPAPAKSDADERGVVVARIEEDSATQPADTDTHDAQTTQPTKDADAAFESWYLRAVTELYGSDLDRLRTEAQDFKAHPAEAVALLSRALRQGVDIYSAAEKRVALGGVKGWGRGEGLQWSVFWKGG